jgi:hypothetical protein
LCVLNRPREPFARAGVFFAHTSTLPLPSAVPPSDPTPSKPAPSSAGDPLAAAKYRAEQLAAQADEAVKRITDAPGVPPPPAMPDFGPERGSARATGSSKRFSVRDNKEAIRLWSLGLNFVGGVAGGLLLGYLVDRWQGTNPWGVLVGAGIGLVGGMWGLIREGLKGTK